MQNIEPDINELLRRAAENYPLAEGEDKWAEIVSKIGDSTADKNQPKKSDRKKYYSALLLLLFIFLSGYFFLIRNNNGPVAHKTQPANIATVETTVAAKSHHKENVSGVVNKPANKTKYTPTQSEVNILYPAIEQTDKIELRNNIGEIAQESQADPVKNQIENTARLLSPRRIIDDSATAELTSSTRNKFSPRHGLYYGVSAGLAVSSVKSSGLKTPGYELGAFAGYRFNEKISLESGLFFGRKSYMSEGKYFSMKEVGAAMTGMDVMQIEGGSYIFQIPLHLRYDFPNKNNQRFFISSGFSSYLLINEQNKYDVMISGAEKEMSGTYWKDRKYFAAAIDLGVGYEKNLGRKSLLRIEPYIQIPLRGIGVGSLPVSSAGLRLGLGKYAH
jgi:hypothetical protein